MVRQKNEKKRLFQCSTKKKVEAAHCREHAHSLALTHWLQCNVPQSNTGINYVSYAGHVALKPLVVHCRHRQTTVSRYGGNRLTSDSADLCETASPSERRSPKKKEETVFFKSCRKKLRHCTHRGSQDDECVCVGVSGLLLSIELPPELPEHLRASQGLRTHLLLPVCPNWLPLFLCGLMTHTHTQQWVWWNFQLSSWPCRKAQQVDAATYCQR